MARRCALYFGLAAYLLVVWYYATDFFRLPWDLGREVIWHGCIGCANVMSSPAGRMRGALLVFGPINAAAYGAIGFVLGKAVVRYKGILR